ncbi:MAG: glycerophosphoryl diester phosphodiesterase membrane domain-containing protein [Pseudomonadota bacterium]|nr:glycerophosphoryl diester phosphodiesterase membrane domain-containing protein [Pseudomonadota bacterium]
MRFDSNRAWLDATALVSANRDVVWAIAGVFLLLPGFAVSILAPAPQAPAGATREAIQQQFLAYFAANWQLMLGGLLAVLLGTLALLALFADRTRPTVAEALRLAATALLPVFASTLIAVVGASFAAAIPLALAMTSGSAVLVSVVYIAGLLAVWAVLVRVTMAMPAIVLERIWNPFAALRRAWQLTKGHVARLLFFYLLLMVAIFVIVQVGGGVIDLGLRLILGGELGAAIGAFVIALLGAIANTYLIAIIAAVHRQLIGPPPAPAIPIE